MKPTTRYFHLTASAFDWSISEDKTIKAWGFNQSVPGPLLKANRGDTVVVLLKNDLPEPTTIHWHGIRLQAEMDGTDEVQKPIQPGEYFEYRFVVPDAGTFWYHSHQNETEQMERGMYGALIVEDDTDPVFDADRVFVIDDMKLDRQNAFKKGNIFGRWKERHDGREGDTVLINGREHPVIGMNAGQMERWRFVNASSARYIVLHLGGKEFSIIATDGGLIEKPFKTKEFMLTPGERVDIAAGPFEEGEEFTIESLPYNRMTFVKPRHRTYATVSVGAAKPSVAQIPQVLRSIEPIATPASPVTRKVKFSVGASLKHGIDFLVNGHTHNVDEPVIMNDLQVWEVSNKSLMDHPFHLHGFFFQVLEENGKMPAFRSWKDTINLRPRSTVKIAWMPERTGKWMYHCHILEHHAAGMMGHFDIIDGKEPYVKAGSHMRHHH